MTICVALDLTPPLPNSPGVLSKWAAEAVRYIFLPSSTFIANAKGYPVLPKPTQTFIRDSMTVSLNNIRIIGFYISSDSIGPTS